MKQDTNRRPDMGEFLECHQVLASAWKPILPRWELLITTPQIQRALWAIHTQGSSASQNITGGLLRHTVHQWLADATECADWRK